MINAQGLTKDFGSFRAVDSINLTVSAGSVVALLGPNGAGKTTTVRMMTSILAPTAGTVSIAGHDVVSEPEQVRAKVGVLTEQHGLYERMKGLDYLDFFGQVYHLPKQHRQARARQLMERFGLGDALNKRLGEYSKGMKQKLALVRAMLHDPPVLLLDEPTSAMDPQSAKLVRDSIVDLQRGERTFLITTHNLTEAQQLADRIAIIRHGRIIANGSFDELARQFTGEPIMELKIDAPVNEHTDSLGELVEVQATGRDWIRYQVRDPRQTNPQVLRKLAGLGVDVITLSPVTRTLEEIYLEVVKEDEAMERTNGNHS
jgi:ABC-2 type transport system ATP-binding protein